MSGAAKAEVVKMNPPSSRSVNEGFPGREQRRFCNGATGTEGA